MKKKVILPEKVDWFIMVFIVLKLSLETITCIKVSYQKECSKYALKMITLHNIYSCRFPCLQFY